MENYGVLEMVLVPSYLVLVGELFVLSDSCQRSDVGVPERRFFHPVAVEWGVVGDVAHLGFLKEESEAAL